ncbi:hypothetical protein DAPPUDRAFT_255931 [Daphnia pulex]|uniref:Uncharacterized protein n=1 Tax=Daphnia pulex TaxID=6669 RepID=E9HAD1_DAPPU|nr:hypothetical protein DAPPUDRAFT_255931 [Daphnia pulex]|eukprot:EFX71286.1 hypothetical protein DAPPUDRAFT_255931 [Daphnia pulex]
MDTHQIPQCAIGRREQSTRSYIVVSFAIHFVYYMATEQLFANWLEKKGKFVASSTESRDFSFDVRVTDI